VVRKENIQYCSLLTYVFGFGAYSWMKIGIETVQAKPRVK